MKRRHEESNIKETFPCEMCDKVFGYKPTLQAHVRNSHSSLPKKRVPCDICNKTFASKSDLGRHKKYIHEEEKRHLSLIHI